MSEDPREFAGQDVNLYRYVYNNATNRTDPTGLFPGSQEKWYGHNDPDFQWWWHRCYWKGMPYDGNEEEIEAGWVAWNALGRPIHHCGGKSPPCPEPEPAPELGPDRGPNWKLIGVEVGIGVGLVVTAALCPECLVVVAPALAP